MTDEETKIRQDTSVEIDFKEKKPQKIKKSCKTCMHCMEMSPTYGTCFVGPRGNKIVKLDHVCDSWDGSPKRKRWKYTEENRYLTHTCSHCHRQYPLTCTFCGYKEENPEL